jgi:hypothetical protein
MGNGKRETDNDQQRGSIWDKRMECPMGPVICRPTLWKYYLPWNGVVD